MVTYCPSITAFPEPDSQNVASARLQHEAGHPMEPVSLDYKNDVQARCTLPVVWVECNGEPSRAAFRLAYSREDIGAADCDGSAESIASVDELGTPSTSAANTDSIGSRTPNNDMIDVGFPEEIAMAGATLTEDCRLCKPDPPQSYPIISTPLLEADTMFAHAGYLIGSIKTMLKNRGIPYDSVKARKRHCPGAEPVDGDQTILIVGPKHYGWNVFLWDVIELTNMCLLGLRWRVEFLTPEAEELESRLGYEVGQ